jgi:hypothetical protein
MKAHLFLATCTTDLTDVGWMKGRDVMRVVRRDSSVIVVGNDVRKRDV